MLANPLEAEDHSGEEMRAILVHHTRASQLRMAAAMDHVIDGPKGWGSELAVDEDWARLMVGTHPASGGEAHSDQVRRVRLVESAHRAGDS